MSTGLRNRLRRLERAVGGGTGMLAIVAVSDGYTDEEVDAVLPPSYVHGNPDNLLVRVRMRLGEEGRSYAPQLISIQPHGARAA